MNRFSKAGKASWASRKKSGGLKVMQKLSVKGLAAVSRGKNGRFTPKNLAK